MHHHYLTMTLLTLTYLLTYLLSYLLTHSLVKDPLSVSGNKVRVYYHLCIRHTKESAFVPHIISEITRCYFHIEEKCFKHVLSYATYYNRYLAIVTSFETVVNIENTSFNCLVYSRFFSHVENQSVYPISIFLIPCILMYKLNSEVVFTSSDECRYTLVILYALSYLLEYIYITVYSQSSRNCIFQNLTFLKDLKKDINMSPF